MKLKRYPVSMTPPRHITTNVARSFPFTTVLSNTKDGIERIVTDIMNERIVPISMPLPNNASAMGMVPNMSAYTGAPRRVANNTENGLLSPRTAWMTSVGIQLCINAPIRTPATAYGKTFLKVDFTCVHDSKERSLGVSSYHCLVVVCERPQLQLPAVLH